MLLSNSGRIVILDDQYDEAKPLIEVLGKNSTPYLYFTGSLEHLPETPIGGIRFVFLDIELYGMGGQNNKTKASTITAILKRLLGPNNGPYVIIFWSKHKEVIGQILENCKKLNISPTLYLDLNKSECIKKNKTYNLTKITDKISKKLATTRAFQLYVEWENIVNSTCKEHVHQFSNLVDNAADWSQKTAHLFHALYKTYVDKNELPNDSDKFKCAAHLLNRSYFDLLENSTSSSLTLPDNFKMVGGPVSEVTHAKLNTNLFLSSLNLIENQPGSIKLIKNDTLLNDLTNFMFVAGKLPTVSNLCVSIITPECDIAQNKLFKHRIVYGVMYENDDSKLHDRGKNSLFEILNFHYKNKVYKIVFLLQSISTAQDDIISKPSIFCLKRDLLFDLQSKAANHVNRLGNYMLK